MPSKPSQVKETNLWRFCQLWNKRPSSTCWYVNLTSSGFGPSVLLILPSFSCRLIKGSRKAYIINGTHYMEQNLKKTKSLLHKADWNEGPSPFFLVFIYIYLYFRCWTLILFQVLVWVVNHSHHFMNWPLVAVGGLTQLLNIHTSVLHEVTTVKKLHLVGTLDAIGTADSIL